MKRHTKQIIVFFVFGLAFLVLDQVTKELVRNTLGVSGEKISAIPGVLNLLYVENRGAAFGIMEGATNYFVISAAVVTIAVLAYLFYNKQHRWPEVIALSMLTSGAIGNVIDRVMHGYVTDFFATAFIDFPVFNVADIGITCGCILFVIMLFVRGKDREDVG